MAFTWAQNISDGIKITPASITEIRNNINIERTRRGLGIFNFNQSIINGSIISLSCINEIRTAIINIKSCSLPVVDNIIDNNVIVAFKNQLDVFNNTQPTIITNWVRTHTDAYIQGHTFLVGMLLVVGMEFFGMELDLETQGQMVGFIQMMQDME